jgi:ubiquinol oxidase
MPDPDPVQRVATVPGPPKLDHTQLLIAQQETLDTPRRSYGLASRVLFRALDTIYGQQRTLGKFKVLELVARVPYQSWEQVAYVAITHVHEKTGIARGIYQRVAESRAQQDNEQWHLLILQEMIDNIRIVTSKTIKFYWLPQILAFAYYQLSWFLFVLRPDWSYLLNADFEDHAEHEYMEFVAEHPEWEQAPFKSAFADDYGHFDSLADLFRQIGHDERVHKLESLSRLRRPRFP